MGLAQDIEKAFLKSMGNPEDKGNIPGLAEGLSKAIQTFLTSVEFRVMELETDIHMDSIGTTGPLKLKTEADVKVTKLDSTVKTQGGAVVTVQTPQPGSGQVTGTSFGDGQIKGTGKGNAKGEITQKLNLKKSQGDGGSLQVKGQGRIIGGDLKDKSSVVLLQRDIDNVNAG